MGLAVVLALAGLFVGQIPLRAEEVPEPVAIVEAVEDTQVDDAGVEEVAPAIGEGVELVEEEIVVDTASASGEVVVAPVVAVEPEEGVSDTEDAKDAVVKETSVASAASTEENLETSETLVEATEVVEELDTAPSDKIAEVEPPVVVADEADLQEPDTNLEDEILAEESVEEPLALASTTTPSVTYRTHVQNVGWQNWVADGAMSGTSGKAYRLEGINIKLSGVSGGITYRTHVQNIGWQDWKSNGEMSGTSGRSLRMEAIEIKLTGNAANKYDVYYRVHCQNIGWMGWAKNGERSGTAGYGYRLEGIQIKLVTKNGSAPSTTLAGVSQNSSSKFKDAGASGRINYRTHVQNEGWQDWVADGAISGTQGKSYRLEGINIKLNGVTGGITYRTHVQNIGWQGWKSNGEMSGTSGQSLRLEAIQIKLTGEAADKYDVYYRVHCQNIGWMGWAKNGESAGSAGYSYRLEGINIKLVAKNGAAPGSTNNTFAEKGSNTSSGTTSGNGNNSGTGSIKTNCRTVVVKEAWDEEFWGTRVYKWFSYAEERVDICRWDSPTKQWVVVENRDQILSDVINRLHEQGIPTFSSTKYENALGEVVHHPAETKQVCD